MMELWHDVCGRVLEGGEGEIAQRGGTVGGDTCGSFEDLVRAWFDIHAGVTGGEVVAAGVSVGYCRILWGKEGFLGRSTGRGRQTTFSI